VELPDPTLLTDFGYEISEFFSKAMNFPRDKTEQNLLAPDNSDIWDRLGTHGTVIYMPECDRLTYARDRTLVEHAVKEMSRVYRRQIAKGLKLYVNNRRLDAFDPTYSMPNARHAKVEGIGAKTSRVVVSKKVPIRINENTTETAELVAKVYFLPIEDWSNLPRKVLKNDLQVFNGLNVSILRNDREVFAGFLSALAKRHSDANWFRVEIDFPGTLDEAFGVAANKQGVRPKGYVLDKINDTIGADITAVREEIKRFQAKRATEKSGKVPSPSEARANEVDAFQSESLDADLSPEDEAQMEANLRGLAVALKREGESDEEALQRVKSSRYLITYRHDDYWPFYHVEHKFGRIVLTLNTAHPFFTELYEPLLKSNVAAILEGEETGELIETGPRGPAVALELMLLSLARAQSVMAREDSDAARTLDNFRRRWSETFRIQLAS
jgi:hypothetical protein